MDFQQREQVNSDSTLLKILVIIGVHGASLHQEVSQVWKGGCVFGLDQVGWGVPLSPYYKPLLAAHLCL